MEATKLRAGEETAFKLEPFAVLLAAGWLVGNNTLDLQAGSKDVPELMRRAGLKELHPVVEIHCEP